MSQARKMRHCLICARVCYAPSRFIWTIFPICRMCALCWRFLKTWACNLKWRREQSRAMGAAIDIQKGYIHARARRLKGCRFVFDCITVTGTENLLMAATLAEGET